MVNRRANEMRPALRRLVLAAVAIFGALGSPSFARADEARVKADSGGIAIGGNVERSCIGDCSIRPEQFQALVQQSKDLSDAQKQIIGGLERDLALNKQQVQSALQILGEANVAPERLESKLIEVAERYKALQEQIASTQPGDDAQILALKADAQKAVDKGDLAKADALLAQIETQQRQALDRLAVNVAETSGKRGKIALTRLQYGEAAKHFANAAAVFPPGGAQENKRIAYLEREADALYRQGDEFGDNGALAAAIDLQTQLLVLTPRTQVPHDWAMTQAYLGSALRKLGVRESGTARLEAAVAAYRAALEELTYERVPRDWAITQMRLGNALDELGGRESGTAELEDAVKAYCAALKWFTRDWDPLNWALTQMNLGLALEHLGERESDPARQQARLREAVAAERAALEERTRERVPVDWAMTQTNLGVALMRLGQRESGTARLDEAVAAERAALEELTRERDPLLWATAQNNLGSALLILGARESGTAHLEEAVSAYRAALEEQTHERVPLDWAASLGNQGVAMMLIADRTNDGAKAEAAVRQIEAAYETTRSGGDEQWAAHYQARLTEAQAIRDRLKGQ